MNSNVLKRGVLGVIEKGINLLSSSTVEGMLSRKVERDGKRQILLDYPLDVKPRWDFEKPHQGCLQAFLARETRYLQNLRAFENLLPQLKKIPLEPTNGTPGWVNGWLPGLDSLSIYGFIATRKPDLYLEIGSGNSTKFARQAIRDFDLKTKIISIDPMPRAEVDTLCDEVIRSPLEAADFSVFERVKPNDIVFIDSSHQVFTNSDVTAFYADALTRIPEALIGIHDIFWPIDYPEVWNDRYYTEQYMLLPLILWKKDFQIELPSYYVTYFAKGEIAKCFQAIFDELPPQVERGGASFWFEWNG